MICPTSRSARRASEGAQPLLRPLHLVVREPAAPFLDFTPCTSPRFGLSISWSGETEFCGQRLAGDFSRRMRENASLNPRSHLKDKASTTIQYRQTDAVSGPAETLAIPVG